MKIANLNAPSAPLRCQNNGNLKNGFFLQNSKKVVFIVLYGPAISKKASPYHLPIIGNLSKMRRSRRRSGRQENSIQIESRLTEFQWFGRRFFLPVSCCLRSLTIMVYKTANSQTFSLCYSQRNAIKFFNASVSKYALQYRQVFTHLELTAVLQVFNTGSM